MPSKSHTTQPASNTEINRRLAEIARSIKEKLRIADEHAVKSDDMITSVDCLLDEAKGLCSRNGRKFAEWKAEQCPGLSKSWSYALAKADRENGGREKLREETRKRVAVWRAGKKADRDVTDKKSVTAAPKPAKPPKPAPLAPHKGNGWTYSEARAFAAKRGATLEPITNGGSSSGYLVMKAGETKATAYRSLHEVAESLLGAVVLEPAAPPTPAAPVPPGAPVVIGAQPTLAALVDCDLGDRILQLACNATNFIEANRIADLVGDADVLEAVRQVAEVWTTLLAKLETPEPPPAVTAKPAPIDHSNGNDVDPEASIPARMPALEKIAAADDMGIPAFLDRSKWPTQEATA